MPCCCDGYCIHDPSLGRSPRPHPDGERTASPLKHPLRVSVTGVGCQGLICSVSFGDTVGVLHSMAHGVTPAKRKLTMSP